MYEFGRLKPIFHQYGGGTAAFFTYTHFGHDLTTGLMVALLALVREDLGLSYLESGLLISAYTITSGVSQLPMGWLGDRMKRNVVAALGLGGVSLAAIAVSLSPSYYPMLAFMILMGIFGGAYHPSAVSLLTGYFESGRRGSVIGLHLLGGSIGFVVGPVLGGLIGGALGWRPAFIILTIPALIAVPLVLKKFKPPDEANIGQATDGTSVDANIVPELTAKRPSLVQVLRPVAFITLLTILIQFVGGASISFLPLYLVDKHGVTPALAAMLVGVVRGGGMVGSLLGGWLSDKWGRESAISLALVMVGPLLYLVTRFSYGLLLMVAFAFFGVAMYTRQSAMQALLMDRSPSQVRSTVFGIYFGLSMEGMSLIQPVAGYFMDILGIIRVFNGMALSAVVISLITLIRAVKLRLTR